MDHNTVSNGKGLYCLLTVHVYFQHYVEVILTRKITFRNKNNKLFIVSLILSTPRMDSPRPTGAKRNLKCWRR